MTTLYGPTIPPASGRPPKRLVVLLHGYGASGADLIDLGRAWAPVLPEALFVSPDAPEPCADFAGGRQWFPITMEMLQSRRLEGVREAAPVVHQYLAELWAETGLTAADTFLVGFSQGAMMALHVGTSMPERLRGVIAFSGALIPAAGFGGDDFAKPPIALVHGDLDNVVDPDLSRRALAALSTAGFDVRLHVSPGTGHGIAPDGLAFATDFLRRQSV